MVVHPAPGARGGTLVGALLHHVGVDGDALLTGGGGEEEEDEAEGGGDASRGGEEEAFGNIRRRKQERRWSSRGRGRSLREDELGADGGLGRELYREFQEEEEEAGGVRLRVFVDFLSATSGPENRNRKTKKKKLSPLFFSLLRLYPPSPHAARVRRRFGGRASAPLLLLRPAPRGASLRPAGRSRCFDCFSSSSPTTPRRRRISRSVLFLLLVRVLFCGRRAPSRPRPRPRPRPWRRERARSPRREER